MSTRKSMYMVGNVMYVCVCGKVYGCKRDFVSHYRLAHVRNPMEDENTRKRVSNTMKRKYRNGEITPYASTPEGKKKLRELSRIHTIENNPMKEPKTVDRMMFTSRERGCYEKASKRMIRKWGDQKYREKTIPNIIKANKNPTRRSKISRKLAGRRHTEEHIQNYKEWLITKNGLLHRGKVSKRMLEHNPMWDSEVVRKSLSSPKRYKKPTDIEQKIIEVCSKYELPFEYVGDFKLFIGTRNPDFVSTNGEKMVIEAFGVAWHKKCEVGERKEYFKRHGYRTLILWGDIIRNSSFEELHRTIVEFTGWD